MSVGQELLDVAPLLLPADSQGLCYSGFITSGLAMHAFTVGGEVGGVGGALALHQYAGIWEVITNRYRMGAVPSQCFYLKITLKEVTHISGACIETDWKVKYLLRGYEDVIMKRQEQCPDLVSFIIELKSILDQVVQSSPAHSFAPPPSFYIDIIEDIEAIGWNRVVHLDQDFKYMKILLKDDGDRDHVLSLHLSDKHPQIAPKCHTSFTFQPSWSSTSSTIIDIIKEHEEEMKSYQPFWNILDEMDNQTWVLEPKNPSYSCVYRRIMIDPDKNLSMYVTFNPLKPCDIPEYRFLGPDHFTNPFVQRLDNAEYIWNAEKSVLENLQGILGIQFPSSPMDDEMENSIECGICYTDLGTTNCLPDVNCPNRQCAKPFHHVCLHEWFSALPNTCSSFNMMKGECPYCNNIISIKIA